MKIHRKKLHHHCTQAEELQPIFITSAEQQQRQQNTMKLSVLKLDGSYFHIVVVETATVEDLKAVLEATVNSLQIKLTGCSNIAWNQVWSNFCLCYMNHKLLDDRASLRSIGIQHDDQIKFARHSGNLNIQKRRGSFFGACFASFEP